MFLQSSIPPSVARRHFESRNHMEKVKVAAMELNDKQEVTELDIENLDTCNSQNLDTRNSQNSDTRNSQNLDTRNSQNSDTRNSQNSDTQNADGQNSDTHNVDNDVTEFIIDETQNADSSDADTGEAGAVADTGDTNMGYRGIWNVAVTGDADASDSDDSDFSMSNHVFSEDDSSDIEASDFEVDPVPDGTPDKGWDFTVNSKKFKNVPNLPFNSDLEFKLLSLFSR
ncbi:hypothetical protein HDU78_008820, partial [Chytriomyces hyalinus]